MMHSAWPIDAATATSNPARSADRRLRGRKNDPMVTGFPSAMSRQPDSSPACMTIPATKVRTEPMTMTVTEAKPIVLSAPKVCPLVSVYVGLDSWPSAVGRNWVRATNPIRIAP